MLRSTDSAASLHEDEDGEPEPLREISYYPDVRNKDWPAPTTMGLVVLPGFMKQSEDSPPLGFPPALFRRLRSRHLDGHRRNRVVKHIWYKTRGEDDVEIFYDMQHENDRDIQYARLVTLNSWFEDLGVCLAVCSFRFLSLALSLMLCADLYFDESYAEYAGDFGFNLVRHCFVIYYILSQLIILGYCAYEASNEVNILTDTQITGDLLADSVPMAFILMTMFQYFGVGREVRNIVIWLHPWKSVQPFAGFKCDGNRAYLVGYTSRFQFFVENTKGQIVVLPIQVCLKVVGVLARIGICYFRAKFTTVFATIPTTVGLFWGIHKWHTIWTHRAQLKAWILGMVRQDPSEHQRMALYKLFVLHFPKDKELQEAFQPREAIQLATSVQRPS